ncbi:alpha/beta fold hydrolase [Sinosporangium siamense]|uniref:Alpha/beta hydrolase n=1 Tax=Sinosporangium siamense TaxID=1367973 RepID=A0A919VBC5_9ACTN|nr:alpha/beta fold hydrolase [Sinosporangium siamense]GII97278.1 alpha/beta hydrolase [Sinosporangium siamense]
MTHLIPPGAREHHISTGAGRLRVLHARPDVPPPTPHPSPLVLIHGGGTDNAAISWYRLIEPLSAEREVWAPDLPGFGGSIDAPPAGGPRELARVVAEAMTALGVTRAVVAGVSMGGDVALNLALEHPHRVAGLILVAPGGLVPIFRNRIAHFGAWAAAQAPDWLLRPATRFANRFSGTAVRALVKDPATLPPEVVAEFVREARKPGAGLGYARYNQATLGRHGMRNDLTGRVHEISAPTLIFHGENDPIVDPAGSRHAADRLPHARLVTVPDCGHWAQLEAHDRFLTDTRAFLDQLA